ncbi:MAG: hypothetical protein H0X26_00710 [Alphaproteobacteria bacterium]|nr:hypothetical protein [Alphaproteobacteria bacterium]
MTTSLKVLAFVLGLLATGVTYSAHAKPTLSHFTLTIKEVSDPQIFVGSDKKPFEATGKNTFKIKGRASDYFFTVNYQHKGASKEAVCEISGIPTKIVATINPAKDGRDACKTEETGRGA